MKNLKVGDVVVRLLAGVVPMQLRVTEIRPDRIVCGPWQFHPETLNEIDFDLDWDGVTRSGSCIKVLSD